jgi:hypothetical protein
MSTVPGWIQKENDQKAAAKRKAGAAAQLQTQAAEFLRKQGMGFWDQLAIAMQSNAQALERLEGEELHGSVSKAVTSAEHNIYVRAERRSVKHGPEAAWMNLWYVPGSGSIRCWYLDRERPNIELVVCGLPEIGQEIRAEFKGDHLKPDELAEVIIRQMAAQVRAK